ncbi:alanine transaminase [Blattamonas nauphoetae]|uniref:Alanine transaminase n=1 Tax=Blattamonas nauphoetae TaxID=2049346 RepID=A0ABQ9WRP1_9EUKA|nr:alanine transaminase [Blattamonas nauphoetae]
MYTPNLTQSGINVNVQKAKYAVRGPVPQRAFEIEQELKAGKEHPFKKVINCNIGNPQLLGQHPISFYREVSSLLVCPDLLSNPKIEEIYQPDVIKRAREMLAQIPGGVGAYSNSQGLPFIVSDVASFISNRDNAPCDPKSVFLTQGASPGIQTILNMLIRSPNDGILVPMPQYPLYTGSIALYGGKALLYELDEQSGWALTVESIQKTIDEARKFDITPRAIVIINPGNPTGACLPRENIQQVLELAHRENMLVMSDEVYQTNIYNPDEKPFISFRQVLLEAKNKEKLAGLELISFNSISKGFFGECGIRGGYFQMENIDPFAWQEIYKLASLNLCPNVLGQCVVDFMVNPPKPGDASYPKYLEESQGILKSLQHRARKLSAALNDIDGCTCQPVESAMYAFPKIAIPAKAVQHARDVLHIPADLMYCFSLLESEGVCVVPGSGFGQASGTYHLRTTILPRDEEFDEMVERFKRHHLAFQEKWKE